MGGCFTSNSIKKYQGARYDEQPQDIQKYALKQLPKLNFYILLSDIKIKHYQQGFVSLKFIIQNITQYQCTSKQVDYKGKAYWRINKNIEFTATELQIRKKYLNILAIGTHKQILATLKINLYTIWIGPYHLDFAFPIKQNKSTRLSFNLKISQGVHIRIQNIKTKLMMMQGQNQGDKINYQMRAIIGQNSYLCEKSQISQFKQQQNKISQKPKNVEWKNEIMKLPIFDKIVPFYQIYSSSLQTIFELINTQNKSILLCECYIGLSKFTIDNGQQKLIHQIPHLVKKIQMQQRCWLHGKQTGKVKIQFNFQIQKHIKQMQSCVRTQEGILTSTPVFINKAKQCQQINNLNKLNIQIQSQFIILDQSLDDSQIKSSVKKIQNCLQKQLLLLQKTSKQSILFYSYKNQQQLVQAQRFLIDLGFKTLSYSRQQYPTIHQYCWHILINILKRGQFKLSYICLDTETVVPIQSKIKVALTYLSLLCQLLKQTLKSLQYKGEQSQQKFAQKFCAYAYFRMPSFRQHILQNISKSNDPQIQQWRGTQVNLKQQILVSNDDFYQKLFDWRKKFLKPLSQNKQYQQLYQRVQKILEQQKWRMRLLKRSGAFFTCLTNIVKQIQYVCVVSKHIKWHSLPGYNKLLYAFLAEMKIRKVKDYTERMKQCMANLLSNEKLLNIFMVIILSKTNINQPQTVYKSIQILNLLFNKMLSNKRFISGSFDYKFLLKGIFTIINSQLQHAIGLVLLFLYNNFQLFNQDFRLQISLYLITNQFYRLFCHWAFGVRQVFQTLIVVKISDLKSNNSRNEQLKIIINERYKQIFEQIQIINENKLFKQHENYNYELFKLMKLKIIKKKKNTLENLLPKHLPSSKSQGGIIKKKIVLNKMFYIDQKIMVCQDIQQNQKRYLNVSIKQFKQNQNQLKKQRQVKNDYIPTIQLKNMMDETQLSSYTTDDW